MQDPYDWKGNYAQEASARRALGRRRAAVAETQAPPPPLPRPKAARRSKLLAVMHAKLNAAGRLDLSRALVDSASVKAPGGGEDTGPNPTDRRKRGSKHHVVTDAGGVPLAVITTAAHRHDVTQLIPLVDAIKPIRGRVGRPRRRPRVIQGDRAYDSKVHRR